MCLCSCTPCEGIHAQVTSQRGGGDTMGGGWGPGTREHIYIYIYCFCSLMRRRSVARRRFAAGAAQSGLSRKAAAAVPFREGGLGRKSFPESQFPLATSNKWHCFCSLMRRRSVARRRFAAGAAQSGLSRKAAAAVPFPLQGTWQSQTKKGVEKRATAPAGPLSSTRQRAGPEGLPLTQWRIRGTESAPGWRQAGGQAVIELRPPGGRTQLSSASPIGLATGPYRCPRSPSTGTSPQSPARPRG